MIDEPAARTLAVIGAAFLATNRALPEWVTDALVTAARSSELDPSTVRQALAVLREAETVEVVAA